jgi:DNA-nicking Smr family endonuclease
VTAPAPRPTIPLTALQAALERAALGTESPVGDTPELAATPTVPRSARRTGLAEKKAAAKAAMRPVRPAGAPPDAREGTSAPRRRAPPAPRRAGERISQLQDLAAVARRLREEQERREAEDRARREAAARAEAERHLFSRSVGTVTPLRNPNVARLRKHLPPPLPVQHWLDEERVLLESISDDFDVSTLLDTDDQLSFRRPGIGVEVTRRLRSGHWSIQRQLDLHGLRVDEAREALGDFIRQAHKIGLRCVRVVHGKGLGSPGKSPVLKGRVQRWLVQKNEVLAFVQARPMDGGAGALVVLLQPVLHRNLHEK